MGFRNIECFNIALLGKQLWRFLECPNSLLARTFKARYFPDTSILQAHLGSRPSYGWRSLLASQPMMLHGLKKEIGDGRSLDMWSDPWILDVKPRPPRAKPHIDRSEWTVADFKEDMGDQWDINLLKQVIETEDVPRILSIKPGGLDSAAGYSWIYNDKGFYSVKSGYKLWECLHSQEQGQVPEQQPTYSSIFEKVWNNGTSSKLKHFIWKCLTSSIAIGTELRKRTLTTDATCQVCGQADEDALHLFFECAFARLVWAQSPYASIISDNSCSIQGRIYSCFMLSDNLDEEYKNLWTWILWRIWKVRNELVYQGRAPNAQQAYNMSCSDSLEWRTNLNAARSSPPSLIVSDDKRWVPPPINFAKCNTDATWQDNHDRCGISWILRNHTGAVIFWGIKTYPKLLSPLDAEATALVWATSCLKNMGYDNIIFESDSSSLIEAVHDPGSRPRLLIYSSEIQGRMIRNDWQIRFEKISRNGNMAADALAKYAKDFPLYHGYLDNRIPLWLTLFLDINA